MDEKISLLRKLSSQQNMRKQLLGGYSEQDVAVYIKNITEHFQKIENEYKQNIEDLQTSKNKLRKESNNYIQQAEIQIVELKESLNKAIAASEEKDEIIISLNKLQTKNKQNANDKDKLAKQLLDLKQETEQLRASTEEANNEKKIHMNQITSLEKELLATENKLNESLLTNEKLQHQIEQLKSQPVNDTVANLNQTIIELEEALKESQAKIKEEQKISKQQKDQIEMVKKAETDKLNQTTKALQEKVQKAEEQLQESKRLAEEQRKESKKTEQQLKSEHEAIIKSLEEKLTQNSKASHSANDIHSIYVQLDKLKEQVTIIENLQQQLDLERTRAEKAEKDMHEFGKWVSLLKVRFNEGQKELELQFGEIEEKMQANVNGLRTNLEVFRSLTEAEIDEFYASIGDNVNKKKEAQPAK